MRVLFWNTSNNNINKYISDIIIENKVNMILLAEYIDDARNLKEELAKRNILFYQYFTAGADGIVIMGEVKKVSSADQNKYYSFQIINNNIILCCTHLPSKIYQGGSERRKLILRQMIKDLEILENKYGICKSIIVGDINANPYESECLDADLLHGIPVARVVEKKQRIIAGMSYKMFYNPMWNLLGDFEYPPGTYYFSGSNPNNSYWHILDQVLIRPALISKFKNEELKILYKISSGSLVDDLGHPLKEISDHLPILFEIEE